MSAAGFVARWQRRTAALFRTPDLEREMAEEMRLHIELEAQEIERTRGLSASDALHQARLSFGSTERFKEEGRDARGTRWIEVKLGWILRVVAIPAHLAPLVHRRATSL